MNNKFSIPTLFAALLFASQTFAQEAPQVRCNAVTVDPPNHIILGKSTVVKLSTPALRMVVGGMTSARAGRPIEIPEDKTLPPGQRQLFTPATNGIADADVMLLSPTELFFIGKRAGSMNVVLQGADGNCSVKDLIVTIDPEPLQSKLTELMPEETGIKVKAAENTLVLTGSVSGALKVDQAMSVAASYGDGKKVVNMLRVAAPQQVMLEVKIAEVSKTLLDKLGASVSRTATSSGSGYTYQILSQFPSNGAALLNALKLGNRTNVSVDAEKDDGLARVLAEPNIMAISGQQASFLSGGKIFIPVPQSTGQGGNTITLEEREFGVGVKFTPTALEGSRLNLKMVTEVSELSQTGSAFSTVNGVTSVLPSLTVRRADTTVQLNDGQSFVIAGLIRNDASEAIKRFPVLGELPIIGALFRSTEFQKNQTELLFVVTPHLVKPLAEAPALPTDNHILPSRAAVYLNGSMEGTAPEAKPAASRAHAQAADPAPAKVPAQAPTHAPDQGPGDTPHPAQTSPASHSGSAPPVGTGAPEVHVLNPPTPVSVENDTRPAPSAAPPAPVSVENIAAPAAPPSTATTAPVGEEDSAKPAEPTSAASPAPVSVEDTAAPASPPSSAPTAPVSEEDTAKPAEPTSAPASPAINKEEQS